MNFKEIQELIRMVNKSDLSLFKVKDKEFELTIKTGKYSVPIVHHAAPVIPSTPIQISTPAVPTSNPNVSPETVTSSEKNYIEIKSPMVGTFYRSSGPDKPIFVKIGDVIGPGTTVCIIEAMKLFNEIESEVKGKIVKVLVEDASPVEYDQPLFLVDPS